MKSTINFDYEKTLPKKLTNNEFKHYFNLYKKYGDIEARNKIIEHNLGLVYKIVYKTFELEIINKYDLVSVATMELFNALNYYDINQNVAFSTYAVTCIIRRIKFYYVEQQIKTFSANTNYMELEDISILEEQSNYVIDDSINGFINHDYLNYLLEILTEKDRDIIEMYFGFGKYNKQYVGREIAMKYNITTQEVYRLINDRLKRLKLSSEDEKYREKKILLKTKKGR